MFESTIFSGQIVLGKQGEHYARRFSFQDVVIWKGIFGEGRCELIHKRNGDTAPYPIPLTIEDGVPYWYVSNVDTSIAGPGMCEIRYIIDNVVVKSNIYITYVQESLGEGTEEPPEPAKAWVDQVLEAANVVVSATTHQPIIGDNGNWFVWDAESMDYIDSGISASGGSGGMTPELKEQIEEIESRMSNVENALDTKIGQTELDTAVESALMEAKESGEFDGEDGITPIKGVDYFTEEEKSEMLQEVIAMLPVYRDEVLNYD